MPIRKFREFLNQEDVRYTLIQHPSAITAQEVAASAHIPGKALAKTVMVLLDHQMAMAVLPASYKVDFGRLKEASGAGEARLATEAEFGEKFPECELGAMPPFGNLYGMEVYVAETLAEDEEITFNAGTHSELIRLAYADFKRLVKPKVIRFSKLALSTPAAPDLWDE
jgi:Ala-tRNA(Pro) deacylase